MIDLIGHLHPFHFSTNHSLGPYIFNINVIYYNYIILLISQRQSGYFITFFSVQPFQLTTVPWVPFTFSAYTPKKDQLISSWEKFWTNWIVTTPTRGENGLATSLLRDDIIRHSDTIVTRP